MIRQRNAASLLAFAALLASCEWNFGGTDSSSAPTASPSYPHMLVGDTLRIVAATAPTADTGNTLASWSLTDTAVVSITNGTSAKHALSATNVLLRAKAPGAVGLTITFPTREQKNPITVGDSSAVLTILLVPFLTSDTIRIGSTATFGVYLHAGSINYFGQPESLYVSDTSLIKLTRVTNLARHLDLHLQGKKTGKTNLVAKFRAITVTRELTVVP